MNFSKKTGTIVTFAAVLILCGLLAANALLPLFARMASQRVIAYVDRWTKAKNIGSLQVTFQKIETKASGRILWKDVEARLEATGDEKDLSFLGGSWRVREVELTAKDLLKGVFFFKIDGLQFQPDTKSRFTEAVQLADESFFIYVTIPPGSLFGEKRKPWPLLREFLKSGVTDLPLRLSGRVTFILKGTGTYLRFRLVEKDGMQVLEVDPGDLREVANIVGEPVTDEEVRVMSGHPMKSLAVLKIKSYARRTAKDLFKGRSKFLESRCRHTLFSYKLTKMFGAKFAKQLTDAREVGDKDDSYLERVMDHEDSKRGREYALEGFSEKEVLGMLEEPLDHPVDKEFERLRR